MSIKLQIKMNNSPNVSKPAEEKRHLRAAKVSQLTKQELTKTIQKNFFNLFFFQLFESVLVTAGYNHLFLVVVVFRSDSWQVLN